MCRDGLGQHPEMRQVRKRLHGCPRLARDDVPGLAGSMAPVTRVMASGSVVSSTCRSAGRPRSEGAAQHLGAQARSAHPEQDTVAPSGFTHFDGDAWSAGTVPAWHRQRRATQAVVDHLGVSRVSGFQVLGSRCQMPVAICAAARCVKRHGGPARVDVLPPSSIRNERIDLLGNAADQLIVRVPANCLTPSSSNAGTASMSMPTSASCFHHPMGTALIDFTVSPATIP